MGQNKIGGVPEETSTVIYPIQFVRVGNLQDVPAPLVRVRTCGGLQLEVLQEVTSTDPPQGRYQVVTLYQRPKGSSTGLTLLKILASLPEHYASKDWLTEHLPRLRSHNDEEDEEGWGQGLIRVDNVVYLLRGLLCPAGIDGQEALRKLLVGYVRNHRESGPGYRLAADPLVWLDVDAIATSVKHALLLEQEGSAAVSAWEQVSVLTSRGAYLPDEPYSDWAKDTRLRVEGYARQAVHALYRLYLAHTGEDGKEQAMVLLRSYWQTHTTDEEIFRPLLELLGKRGHLHEADEDYHHLCQHLELEGRTPSSRTQQTIQNVRAASHEKDDLLQTGETRSSLPASSASHLSQRDRTLSPFSHAIIEMMSEREDLRRMKKDKHPNEALRYHRLLRGWSQTKVADEIGASNEMISNWERGQKKTSSFYQEKLCALFGMNAAELGFLGPTSDNPSRNEQQVFLASERKLFPVTQIEELNSSSGIHSIEVSNTSITNLAIITEQFRAMQRRGDVLIVDGINTHIKTIQETLEWTLDDNSRCELWRVLAQTQIVSAFNPMKKTERGRVKTFLETAVASAQNSNDMVLMGAALGHLAQFVLREEQNLTKSLQLIRRAKEYIPTSHPLNGWFLLVMASLAAKAGHEEHCEAHLTDAMTIAHHLPKTPEYTDIYFTDFGLISVQIFIVNSWLTMGNAEKAYTHLTRINLEDLSDNRRASAFCDAAKACAMMEEFPMAQDFAFQAIDKALATRQDYVIARCRELAQMLQKKERGKSYASALTNYIHFVATESEGARK